MAPDISIPGAAEMDTTNNDDLARREQRDAANAGESHAEHANDNILHHDSHPTAGDEVGEAVGGVSGVVTGAAIGSLGGPIGTVIGGIAGAVGGWWAGRAVSEAAKNYTHEDDTFYRDHYEHESDRRLADRSYEQVRPAYQLGHVAGRNPEYAGRSFDTVEPDLRRGWDSATSAQHGDWEQVRGYARDAYARSAAMRGEAHHLTEEQDAAAENDDKRIDDTMDVRLF